MLRLEDLQRENIKVYQDDELYCFTSDAILLSEFARVKKGDTVADFCAGCGIVGFNLYSINKSLIESVTLFEMQKPLFELSKKSIEYNGLENKFSAVNEKLQNLGTKYAGKFSLITCNPPYMATENGFTGDKSHIAICRAEVELKLCELIKAVSYCLKFGGRINLVHRADRLIEVITEMKKYGIEPKRLKMVHSTKNSAPNLFLIEGMTGASKSLKMEQPIYLYEE